MSKHKFSVDLIRLLEASPKMELLWRLNCGLQGRDPGAPINTRFWRIG